MKIKKLFLIFTALSAISFSFISCFNIFNQLEENPCNDTEEGAAAPGQITNLGIPGAAPIIYATLQGHISFDGALPAEVLTATSAGTDNGDNGSERTALPSMSTTWVYVLQATADGQTTPAPVVVQANSTAPGYSYPGLATSQSGISWTITVRLKKNQTDSDDLGIMIDSCTLNLTNDNSIYVHDFMVKPATGGSGTLDLLMKVPVSVASISVECSDTGWVAPTTQISTITGDTANKNASIQKSGIPSGTYSVRFNFKDSNGLLLYSNRQSINIFNNCTTSIWVNSGTTGNSDPIDSSGNYTVTQAMITNFQNNTFYVGPTSFNDTPGTVANGFNGTPIKPLSNVSDVSTIIGARADSTTAEYTILVNGAISGTQSITSACNGKAKSIRLCGLDTTKDQTETWKPKHQLTGDAQNGGTTLTIGTSVLVTIDNLLITGGSNPNGNGGGIAITGGNVELTSGAVVNGNTAQVGGGVYLTTGNLYLNGTAVVGKPISALGANPTRAGTTSGTYANKATQSGGGIEVYEGALWLGYRPPAQNETQPQALTTSGGVIYNLVAGTAETHGGGIDNNHGTLNIAHGFVSYNYAFCESGITKDGCGGGITTADAMYLLGDATISHNESAYGGAVYISKGRNGRHGYFTMSGGTIESNASNKQNGIDGDGGGIAIGASGSFEMSGGTIKLNTAESRGGAIFHNGSLCKISGGTNCTATIPEGDGTNNIFLIQNGQTITLEGSTGHTGTGEIAVTAQSASRGVTVLTGDGVADYYSKFKLTDVYGMGIKNTGKIDLDVIVTDIYVNKNATAANSFTPASGSYTKNDSTWNNSTYAFNASSTSSQSKPFTSIDTALKFITYQASEQDYTIHIVGTYTVASSTEINITNNSNTNNPIKLVKTATQTNPTVTAKSITIDGVTDATNPPIISGANTYRCLSIATEVPVIISNISINNGYFNGNSYGAGITIDTQNGPRKSDVTLSTGAIIQSNSGTRAGAIYNFGTLTIAGAQISDNSATDTSYGNGGAIRNEGGIVNIYGDTTIIGAAGDETTGYALNVTTPTKKYSNYAGEYGGAIYNDLCNYNGTIYYGEINIGKDAENNYSSPKIEYNYSDNNGGGIYNFSNCIINFYGGSVSYCTAGVYGGGIYNEGKLSLKQAARTKTIKTNYAYAGGAVCEYGENASFTITPYTSNAAYISIPCSDSGINSDNTIYLGRKSGSNPCQITITELLQYGCDYMRIDTDFSTFKGKPIITTSNDYTPSLNDYNISLGKFSIKQPSGSKYSYFYSSEKLTTDPAICQTSCNYPTLLSNITNTSVGDIVMKDGDIIKYEAGFKLGTKKEDAVAIIFHNGTGLGAGTRVLGMAADLSTLTHCNWANGNPASDIPALTANVSGTNFSGSGTRFSDGSSNYSYAVNNSTSSIIFEAMRYCANYKNYKANLVGTTYESGWYLPSIRELYKVYENIATINAVFTNAFERSRGMEFYTFLGGQSGLGGGGGVRDVPFWSSNTEEYAGSGDLKIWSVYLGDIKEGDTRITAHKYNYNNPDGGIVLPIRQFN